MSLYWYNIATLWCIIFVPTLNEYELWHFALPVFPSCLCSFVQIRLKSWLLKCFNGSIVYVKGHMWFSVPSCKFLIFPKVLHWLMLFNTLTHVFSTLPCNVSKMMLICHKLFENLMRRLSFSPKRRESVIVSICFSVCLFAVCPQFSRYRSQILQIPVADNNI